MNTPPSALFTDQYQFTMFDAYVDAGMVDQRVTFDLFFRRAPDGASFAIACGLDEALDFLENLHFESSELTFLEKNLGLSAAALGVLKTLRFEADMWAILEGTPVLAQEPLLRITGPLGLLQLIETPLLNIINYHTLIATKASRIVRTARPATVVEFGLRRAQGFSASLSAARAAYIAGVSATSNVAAAQKYGIPGIGTMAHSYVMSFPDELAAFRAYVKKYPNQAVLLIDTYDTLKQGIHHAIAVAQETKKSGGCIRGVRLDSGDLIGMSKEVRKRLDQAGLRGVKIFASNDLDEYQILEFHSKGAKIDGYGVGTRLVTAYSEPALGGVYKLSEVEAQPKWIAKMKTTSDPHKATLPGRKTVFRVMDPQGSFKADIIGIEGENIANQRQFLLLDRSGVMNVDLSWHVEPLLHQVWKGSKRLLRSQSLDRLRAYCAKQMTSLPEDMLRFHTPKPVPVLLSHGLAENLKFFE